MGLQLPECDDPKSLLSEVQLVPAALREDAVQEAWVASLSGECPIAAVKRIAVRELRYRRRFGQFEENEDGAACVARGGTIAEI